MSKYTINEILRHRDTPGHGYFSFRGEFSHLINNIPEKFRQHEYEEDCDWAIPLLFNFGLLSTFKEKRMVLQSALNWSPKAYEALKKRKPSRRLSYLYNQELLFKENKGKMYSVVGYGDWCFDIPEGYVYRGFVLNNGNDDSSRLGDKVYALLTYEEDKSRKLFYDPEFIKSREYKRDESYYTWDDYTKKTGKPRYK